MHINYVRGLFGQQEERDNIPQVICLAHNSNYYSNHHAVLHAATCYSFSRSSLKTGSSLDAIFKVMKLFLKSEW